MFVKCHIPTSKYDINFIVFDSFKLPKIFVARQRKNNQNNKHHHI